MITADPLTIRPAEPADAGQLASLVRGLLAHHGDDSATFDPERFADDAFGPEPQFSVLVAEGAGRLVGYALFHDAYEPAYTARGVYLCDLFVDPGARRQGVGRALMAAVAKDAAARSRTFLWWVVRTANEDAHAFYQTLCDIQEPVTAHALAFEAFERLATDQAPTDQAPDRQGARR